MYGSLQKNEKHKMSQSSIKILKVKDLKSYESLADSEDPLKITWLPESKRKALVENPDAEADDMAVMFSFFENKPVGRMHVISGYTKINSRLEKCHSGSDWFVDEKFRGAGAVMLLTLKKHLDNIIAFGTSSIASKVYMAGGFKKGPVIAHRAYIFTTRFAIEKYLKHHTLSKLLSFLIDVPLKLFTAYNNKFLKNSSQFKIELKKKFDDSCDDFIQKYIHDFSYPCTVKQFNSMIDHQWETENERYNNQVGYVTNRENNKLVAVFVVQKKKAKWASPKKFPNVFMWRLKTVIAEPPVAGIYETIISYVFKIAQKSKADVFEVISSNDKILSICNQMRMLTMNEDFGFYFYSKNKEFRKKFDNLTQKEVTIFNNGDSFFT